MATVHTNGSSPRAEVAGEETIAALRIRPLNVHLFRGLGPLVVGVVLFLLMLWLTPSVAPEHIIDQPVPTTIANTVRSAP